MKVELVTFDLDNTVWEEREVLLRATRETNAWILEQVPNYESLDATRLQELREEVVRNHPVTRHNVSAFRCLYMERCFEEIGIESAEAARLAQEAFDVFMHWRVQVQPYPEAEALLQSLSRTCTVASITNGNADVTRTALNEYFRFNVSAIGFGCKKPDAEIFNHTLALAGIVDPVKAIHVGDNFRDDVEGATGVGMQTIWLDHARTGNPGDATIIVHHIAEVGDAIQTINASL